jgi:hypothetical protein
MAGNNRGKSKQVHEDTPDANSTAVNRNGPKGVASTIGVAVSPGDAPTPDTGTPLPDDPSVLKENVKGLKSQLRKHKQSVRRVIFKLRTRGLSRDSRKIGPCLPSGGFYSHWVSSVASHSLLREIIDYL